MANEQNPPGRPRNDRPSGDPADTSGRLVEKSFWDGRYGSVRADESASPPAVKPRSLWRSYISDYNHQVLLHALLARTLPPDPAREFMEVGSAPGEMLVELRKLLGGTPYGVEYSELGVEMNRRTFARHGIPPENVIHSDFFAPEFQARNAKRFGLVLSRGFIEHFSTPEMENVINHHLALVNDGGYLLISIPNLTGFRGLMTRWFNRSLLPAHNLEIMRLDNFRRLFERAGLETVFCDYLGVPDLEMPHSRHHPLLRAMQKPRHYAQLAWNLLCCAIRRDKTTHHPFFSPDLLFIGRVNGHKIAGRASA